MKRGIPKIKDKKYYNSSYRKRFIIETLWMIPGILWYLLFIFWLDSSMYLTIPITILVITISFIQIHRNCKRCEEEDKKDKKDKGFELAYRNLSYRRRFIRTLWFIPVVFLVLPLMIFNGYPMYIIVYFVIISTVQLCIQAYYNYKKWKSEDK